MQGVSPQSALPLSTFYDKNHNPLNIPCEGPKAVPINIDPSIDTSWTIDFTYLFQQSQMSAVQGVYMDLMDFAQTGTSGSLIEINVLLSIYGTNQRINIYNGQDYGMQASQPYALQGIWIPLACLNPPKIELDFEYISEVASGDPLVRLLFINHIPPQFNTGFAVPPA
jgi:hypothetical protein